MPKTDVVLEVPDRPVGGPTLYVAARNAMKAAGTEVSVLTEFDAAARSASSRDAVEAVVSEYVTMQKKSQ